MSRKLLDLGALKRGNETEWTAAFKELWPLTFHAAQHPEARLSTEEAEEVASEALGQLVAKIDTVATVDQLKSLVCTIAHRRAISLARRKSAAKRGPIPVSLDALAADGTEPFDLPSDVSGHLSEVEFREMVLLLHLALKGLDAETRALLQEKIGLGMSYDELARRYGKPIGTVCTKVSRGLGKLREALHGSPVLMKELREFLR